MTLICTAYRAGIWSRALEILDELTAKPTQQIRSETGQLRAMWRRRGR